MSDPSHPVPALAGSAAREAPRLAPDSMEAGPMALELLVPEVRRVLAALRRGLREERLSGEGQSARVDAAAAALDRELAGLSVAVGSVAGPASAPTVLSGDRILPVAPAGDGPDAGGGRGGVGGSPLGAVSPLGTVLLVGPPGEERTHACDLLEWAGLPVRCVPTGADLDAGAGPLAAAVVMGDLPAGPSEVSALRQKWGALLPIVRVVRDAAAAPAEPLAAGPGSVWVQTAAGVDVLTALAPWLGPAPRVLVVDDDESARQLLQLRLRRAGQPHVRVACGGPEALACVSQWQPALVLLDQEMPGMRGEEVAPRLRALSAGWPRRPTIVLVSGHPRADLEGLLAVAELDDFVSKPVRRGPLEALLAGFGPPMPAPQSLASTDPEMAPLVALYLQDLETGIRDMQAALRAEELDRLQAVAHRFRGTGAAYGFPGITAVCGRIGVHAARGEGAAISRMLFGLAHGLRRLVLPPA